MKTSVFSPSDPNSILNFLTTFKKACDSSGFHEDTAVWCVKHFMSNSADADLVSRLYLKNKTSDKLEGSLSFRKEIVNVLLETYTIEGVIAKADIEIQNFKISSNTMSNDYAEPLWTKALRCS